MSAGARMEEGMDWLVLVASICWPVAAVLALLQGRELGRLQRELALELTRLRAEREPHGRR